jgi:hypothetical protein
LLYTGVALCFGYGDKQVAPEFFPRLFVTVVGASIMLAAFAGVVNAIKAKLDK